MIYDCLIEDHTIEITRKEDQTPLIPLVNAFPELKDEAEKWLLDTLIHNGCESGSRAIATTASFSLKPHLPTIYERFLFSLLFLPSE